MLYLCIYLSDVLLILSQISVRFTQGSVIICRVYTWEFKWVGGQVLVEVHDNQGSATESS